MTSLVLTAFRLWVLLFDLLTISSLPIYPTIKGKVQYCGFIGDRVNYGMTSPRKRWAGMLGLRYRAADETSMYALTPDTKLLDDKPTLVEAMLLGESWTGQVLDHDLDFIDAIQSPQGFIYVFYNVPETDCKESDCGYASVLADVEQSGQGLTKNTKEWTELSKLSKRYGFPPWAPRHYKNKDWSSCDDLWLKTCFMAGSYPISIGLPVPEGTGDSRFEVFLAHLAGLEGAFCRCYKSGSWQPSTACDTEREQQLFQNCTFDEPRSEL